MGNISIKASEVLGISDEDGSETKRRHQYMPYEHNLMYRMVYFYGKGWLVAKTKKLGDSMKDYLTKELEAYLYENGDGKELTKTEFAKYMYENNYLTVNKVDKPQPSSEDLIKCLKDYEKSVCFSEFKQHQICWDLNKRGEEGETILHLCFLNNTDHHRSLAHSIMECYPQMALDIYEGPEYYGQGMLHMAIVNNDIESVKLLIYKYHVRIDQRATGRFFCPKDMKIRAMKEKNLHKSKYEGEAYFGEYPLAFAASVGSKEIYDILVNANLSEETCGRADPNAKDSFGNTVLHMLVIHNQVDMFIYVASHKLMPPDHELQNDAELNPIELSIQLGRSKMFSNLLDLASVPQWSLGEFTYAAYPLSFIDTIGPNGETNEDSALRRIVHGKTQEHLEMLDGEIINTLLMHKWKRYAKRKILCKFVCTLVYLSLLSAAIYLRPKGDLMSSDANAGFMERFYFCSRVYVLCSVLRWIVEICVLVGCVLYTIFEVKEVISRGSIRSYLDGLYWMPAKSAFIISIIMLYICVPLRLFNLKNVEELFLSIILPFSWIYILFFYRTCKWLGPFVHMIKEMLRGDLLRFSIIYAIFIFMFSQVFYHMYRGTDVGAFATALVSVMSVFKMTLGDFSDKLFDRTNFWFLSRVVFGLFAVFLPILLVNMLIAMMGRTYTNIEQKAKSEWKRQFAIIVLNVESAISKKYLAKMRLKYSTEIKRTRKRKNVPRKWSLSLESIVTVGGTSNKQMYHSKVEPEEEKGEEEEEVVEETFRALMFLKRSHAASQKNLEQPKKLWKKSDHYSKKAKGKANSKLEGNESELRKNPETQVQFTPMFPQHHVLPTVSS